MKPYLSGCHAGFETRRRSCRLSVRAERGNRKETGCMWRGSATPGLSTQPFAWAESLVRPRAADLGVITQSDSGRQRRMLFPIAARDLQSTGRPDFTGLPEHSP